MGKVSRLDKCGILIKYYRENIEMAKQNHEPYPTDNIDLASYLHALGGEVIDIDKSNPKEQVFLFKLTDDQRTAIPHFFDGSGQVSALVLSNSRGVLFRMLRNKQPINK